VAVLDLKAHPSQIVSLCGPFLPAASGLEQEKRQHHKTPHPPAMESTARETNRSGSLWIRKLVSGRIRGAQVMPMHTKSPSLWHQHGALAAGGGLVHH